MPITKQENLDYQLREAARYADLIKLKDLLDQGAYVNATDRNGWTALHFASRRRVHLNVVKELLERGAAIEAQTNTGSTALHFASTKSGDLKIVKYLLDAGANIEAKDNDGWTAIHFASRDLLLQVAKELIGRGARIDSLTVMNFPALALDRAHEQVKMEDKWASAFMLIIREQNKYSEKYFKERVLEFIDKTKAELPDHIRIILNTLI